MTLAPIENDPIESATNVGDPERWLSVVAGAAIVAYGLTRRSISGLLIAGAGGALLWRGATGQCPLYQSLGISTAGLNGVTYITPDRTGAGRD